MYFTCEKCFRVPWTLSGHLLARSSISPSGGVSWTNNLNFAVVKSFWWSTKAKSLSKCKWSSRCILGHFEQNQRRCFFSFKKLTFLCQAFCCCCYFCLTFAIYGRFWTLSIKSGLIPSLWMQKGQQNHKKCDQRLIWNFGCSTYPKSHPVVKIDP